MVLRLLGADAGAAGGTGPDWPAVALKGVVGRALAGAGMTVHVRAVYHDDVAYQVHDAVEVTNPARRDHGRVLAGDDAALRWECPLPAAPGQDGKAGSEEIVRAIAGVLAGMWLSGYLRSRRFRAEWCRCGAVAVLGQQPQERSQPGRVLADAAAGQQLAVPACQGDVVVVFGPVDPAEHFRSAVRDPSCPQGPGPGWSSAAPAVLRGLSCGWLRPRPPIPAGAAFPAHPGRRVMRGCRSGGWRQAPACARGSGPGCAVRVTWHQPPAQPDSADLRSKPPVPGGVKTSIRPAGPCSGTAPLHRVLSAPRRRSVIPARQARDLKAGLYRPVGVQR